MLKRWAALPRGIRWLAGLAVVVLGLAIAWALFVPITDWLARHDVGSAGGPLHETAVDNARGRLLTLGAGLVAAAALVFTALNFSLLRRNSEQADQWQRRTHELTEQGQVTDRYTKAIEQLGSDKLDVRLGGIYALERIARDSPKDHPTVMEVLTAFIREHSREPWPLPGPDEEDADLVELTRPDVQAALTVVGRRDIRRDARSIDLVGANLVGASLLAAQLGGADLKYARLTRADLNFAYLREAFLTGADLTGADIAMADLAAARVTGVSLTGALLSETDLTGADLTDAHLAGACLPMAHLAGARLLNADFTGAYLGGADLAETKDLTTAHLTDANLTDTRWPADAPVPEGWELDADSGTLQRAGTSPASAEEG